MACNLDLVVPLYNEEGNVEPLVEDFAGAQAPRFGLRKLYLINNGSTDNTGAIANSLAKRYDWITPVHIKENCQYGGGILHGLKKTEADYIGYLPGDNQISANDAMRVWHEAKAYDTLHPETRFLVKGVRNIRHDGVPARFTSKVYTNLGNQILSLGVQDINGLPKIFHRSLLDHLPESMMRHFTFDAQILQLAKALNFEIREVPVVFHARNEGKSSWSGKRLQTYARTFRQLVQLRNNQ